MNIYNLRAPVSLLTAIAVVLSTFAVAIPVQAGVPALSVGGPPNGQTNVPLEAFIDINASEALNPASVSASTVTLYSCTGATDASSCASPVTATNLCGTVNLENSNTRIICITSSPLSVSTTYRFSVLGGGIGITAAAVSGYFWYRDMKAKKRRTPSSAWLIVPSVGDTYAGASAAAEF